MFFQRKLRAHDAKHGEEEDENRQLEADAKAEDDRQEEAGVVLDGDHGREVVAEVNDEDLERAGQNVEVAKSSRQPRNRPTVAAMKGMTKRRSRSDTGPAR